MNNCKCEARTNLPRRLMGAEDECSCYIVRCRFHEDAESLVEQFATANINDKETLLLYQRIAQAALKQLHESEQGEER